MKGTVEREALVVGLSLVPGLVTRNKSFALFEDPDVRRARRRAGVIRGIVRQLTGTHGGVEELTVSQGEAAHELRYRIPTLHIERRAVLSSLELACVRYLVSKVGVPGLTATEEDRAMIDAALRRLSSGLHLAGLDADRAP